MPVLDVSAETLRANPKQRVEVNGYTDAIGSEAYNLLLAKLRAEAVVAYLESKVFLQVIPRGFGKTNFVATNKTAEGRAQNRRVELIPVGQ